MSLYSPATKNNSLYVWAYLAVKHTFLLLLLLLRLDNLFWIYIYLHYINVHNVYIFYRFLFCTVGVQRQINCSSCEWPGGRSHSRAWMSCCLVLCSTGQRVKVQRGGWAGCEWSRVIQLFIPSVWTCIFALA